MAMQNDLGKSVANTRRFHFMRKICEIQKSMVISRTISQEEGKELT